LDALFRIEVKVMTANVKNRKRKIPTWLNIIIAVLVLVIALVNGISILEGNEGMEPGPWKIGWIFVNIQMWVNLFWGVAILIKRVPNWFLFVVGVMGTILFGYLNVYVQDFFWIQDLILSLSCLFFAYEAYRDYRAKAAKS